MSTSMTTESLIARARRALADHDAKTGRIIEARFRYLNDAPSDELATNVEVLSRTEGTITRRVSIHGGKRDSSVLIAEYEEHATLASAAVVFSAPSPDGAEHDGNGTDEEEHRPAPQLSTAQKRRRQIFEGACEVISQKGYGDATVREIAKASGVSVPSLYQYVSSKEDILFMITEECMRELFDAFKRNMDTSMSPAEKMQQAIADYVAYISRNRKYINLVYRETRSLSARYRDRVFDLERSLMSEWEQIFRDGRDQGLFQDIHPSLVANIAYFSCSVWALRHWAVGNFDEAETRDALTRMLMQGILVR